MIGSSGRMQRNSGNYDRKNVIYKDIEIPKISQMILALDLYFPLAINRCKPNYANEFGHPCIRGPINSNQFMQQKVKQRLGDFWRTLVKLVLCLFLHVVKVPLMYKTLGFVRLFIIQVHDLWEETNSLISHLSC